MSRAILQTIESVPFHPGVQQWRWARSCSYLVLRQFVTRDTGQMIPDRVDR